MTDQTLHRMVTILNQTSSFEEKFRKVLEKYPAARQAALALSVFMSGEFSEDPKYKDLVDYYHREDEVV